MVTINYHPHNPRVFALERQREPISQLYCQREADGAGAELRYYLDLLRENKLLTGDDSAREIIWSTHYPCSHHGIPFTMVYDADYGFVHFAVERPDDRAEIAEMLRRLAAV